MRDNEPTTYLEETILELRTDNLNQLMYIKAVSDELAGVKDITKDLVEYMIDVQEILKTLTERVHVLQNLQVDK